LGVGLDELFNSNGAGSNETFLRDALNSTVAVTSSSESVLDQPIYDPYGNTSDSEAFGFTGREIDGNGGFYFMRAGYYDGAIARFISRDPSGLPAASICTATQAMIQWISTIPQARIGSQRWRGRETCVLAAWAARCSSS
jgi:RHS repeat-associated protein